MYLLCSACTGRLYILETQKYLQIFIFIDELFGLIKKNVIHLYLKILWKNKTRLVTIVTIMHVQNVVSKIILYFQSDIWNPTYIDSGARWLEKIHQPYTDDIHKVYIPLHVHIRFFICFIFILFYLFILMFYIRLRKRILCFIRIWNWDLLIYVF